MDINELTMEIKINQDVIIKNINKYLMKAVDEIQNNPSLILDGAISVGGVAMDYKLKEKQAVYDTDTQEFLKDKQRNELKRLIKERDYWHHDSDFKLNAICNIEKQLVNNCITSYYKTLEEISKMK